MQSRGKRKKEKKEEEGSPARPSPGRRAAVASRFASASRPVESRLVSAHPMLIPAGAGGAADGDLAELPLHLLQLVRGLPRSLVVPAPGLADPPVSDEAGAAEAVRELTQQSREAETAGEQRSTPDQGVPAPGAASEADLEALAAGLGGFRVPAERVPRLRRSRAVDPRAQRH